MSENINVCLFSYPSRPKILNSDFLLFLSFPDCIGITGSLLPMWCRMNHCCFYATKRGKPFQKCPANTHKCAVSNWTRMMWKPLIKFVNHLVCAIVPTLFYPVHRTDSYLHTHWYASGALVQHPSFLSCFHFLFILVCLPGAIFVFTIVCCKSVPLPTPLQVVLSVRRFLLGSTHLLPSKTKGGENESLCTSMTLHLMSERKLFHDCPGCN